MLEIGPTKKMDHFGPKWTKNGPKNEIFQFYQTLIFYLELAFTLEASLIELSSFFIPIFSTS